MATTNPTPNDRSRKPERRAKRCDRCRSVLIRWGGLRLFFCRLCVRFTYSETLRVYDPTTIPCPECGHPLFHYLDDAGDSEWVCLDCFSYRPSNAA